MDDYEQRKGANPILVGGLAGCGVVLVLGLIGLVGLVVIMGRGKAESMMLQAQLAELEAEREQLRYEVVAENERTQVLIEEIQGTRRLVTGDEYREVNPEHYRQTVLAPAGERLRAVLRMSPETRMELEERGARNPLLELEQLESRRPVSLVEVCMANEALTQIVLILAEPTAGPSSEDLERQLKEATLRSRAEIDELRSGLNEAADELLEALRDLDRARRALEEIETAKDLAAAQQRAQDALAESKPR